MSKAPRVDLFVFADALGWQQVERRAFLADLLPHRAKCDTLLGYSCTCDPSILTGALPAEHGHFSFFVFDPAKSPFRAARWLGWLPELLAGHHRVRNRVSRWWQKRLGYTGYFQLYSVPFRRLPHLDYTEKRDIYRPGGILGGQPMGHRPPPPRLRRRVDLSRDSLPRLDVHKPALLVADHDVEEAITRHVDGRHLHAHA